MTAYHVGETSRRKLFRLKENVDRRARMWPPQRRRRTPPAGKTAPAGPPGEVDIVFVHIDEDILGAEEDEDVVFDPPYQDPMKVWCYERREVNLKYYKEATSSDPGYESGKTKLILATEENEYGEFEYSTQTFYYDDGADFLVGEYTRSDYPDFDENEIFPPAGLPEGFLNKRYRAVAVNGTIMTIFCEVLSPPPLPDEGS